MNSAAQPPPKVSMTSKLSDGMKKSYDKLKSMLGESGMVVILLIIFVLIFVIVIIYVTFKIKSSDLSGKRLTTSPIKLDTLSQPVEIPNSLIPVPTVGLEYTYGMWVYVENLDQTSSGQTTDKLIFYRGEPGNLTIANPVILLDGVNSKMYIVIKTTNSTLSSTSTVNYTSNLNLITDKNCFMSTSADCTSDQNQHIVMTIDYVPIQRWVHVMFSVDNKLLTVFVDGEIYSVKSTDEFKAMKSSKPNLIIDKTTGSIFIGKNASVGGGNTMNGYLSRLEFYNYALSFNDVRNVYKGGPYNKSFLSTIGLQNYGVRNPLYRLDSVAPSGN